MKVGSLFSGIGGLDLGFERAGFDIAWMCEKDLFCRSVLAHHWPGIPIYEDVHDLSSESVPGVDVLIGGFPCQPFSVAGKQRGHEDERYLWPEAMRLVRELRPDWTCFENVPGIRAIGADRVCEDLESEGYSVWPLVVGADDVGAPHRRKRVFFVAHAADRGLQGDSATAPQEGRPSDSGRDAGELSGRPRGPRGSVADRNGGRCEGERLSEPGRIECSSGDEPHRCDLPLAYAESSGRTSKGNGWKPGSRSGCDGASRTSVPDPIGTRLEGRESQWRDDGAELPTAERVRSLVNATGARCTAGSTGSEVHAGSEPLAGRWPAGPGQEQHAWEPPRTVPGLGRVPHGLPGRVDSATRRHRLKALGNAVVPAVSEVIARAILEAAP